MIEAGLYASLAVFVFGSWYGSSCRRGWKELGWTIDAYCNRLCLSIGIMLFGCAGILRFAQLLMAQS